MEYRLSPEDIELGEHLGAGACGVVQKGNNLGEADLDTADAIKCQPCDWEGHGNTDTSAVMNEHAKYVNDTDPGTGKFALTFSFGDFRTSGTSGGFASMVPSVEK